MSYIKFINDDTQYPANIMPFTSQHGKKAVRIVSAPLEINESGFMYYNDNDEIIGDYSDYQYHYEGNSYTVEKDNIVYGSGSDAPLPKSVLYDIQSNVAHVTNYVSRVDKNVQEVTKEVVDITPYVETKTAYIDDTEIIFEVDKQGVISVNAVNRNNETVPVTYEKDGNKIIVLFDPLEEVTDITIQIQ